MTNRERLIEKLNDPSEYQRVIHRITSVGDSMMDWNTWLESEDPTPVWYGRPGIYKELCGRRVPCIIGGERYILGEIYYKILIVCGKDVFSPDFDVQKVTVPQDVLEFDIDLPAEV